MDKKVLVTGGAGFIGSHLCEALVSRGYKVTVIDNLSTGKLDNIKFHSLPVAFVNGTITDLALLQDICGGVEFVFHLAAMNRAPRSIENPIDANKVNIDGTLNVLVAARDNKVKKVVYTSSSSVYGGDGVSIKREVMKPNPETPYAVSKLAGEYYCGVFQKLYGLSSLCLRYFSVYGKRQRPDVEYAAVVPVFIDRISHGMPPIIFGDGEQTRNFTYVRDAVAVTVFLAESEETGIFNVSYSQPVSVNKLANLVAATLKKKVTPVYEKKRTGDVKHLSANISKLLDLKFILEYDIQAGLRDMVSG